MTSIEAFPSTNPNSPDEIIVNQPALDDSIRPQIGRSSDGFMNAAVANAQGGDWEDILVFYNDRVDSALRSFIQSRTGEGLSEQAVGVDDMIQAVWERTIRHVNRLDFSHEQLTYGWFFKLARQVFIDELRRREKDADFPLDDEIPGGQSGMEEDLEINVDLETALNSLKPKQFTVVILSYYGGMSIAEIAEITGNTEGGVKSLLNRAKDNLRKKLT